MENKLKKIKELLKTEQGKPLKEFLLGYYKKLSNIESVKDCDRAEDQAIELKATKKAIRILEEIYNQIVSIEEYEEEKGSDNNKDSVIIE